LAAEMERASVDRTFLISYDAEDTKWGAENDGAQLEDFAGGRKYTLRQARLNPGRFYWFNTLKNPWRYDLLSFIDRDLADGAAGFKLFPAYVQATLNDEKWMAAFKAIADTGARLLVSFETLRPPRTSTLPEYLGQLSDVLDRIPDLQVALLHAGCADPLTSAGDAVVEFCERHPGIYLSNAMPGEVWDDAWHYPFPNLLARVGRLRDRLGADRLMWATDWPWFNHMSLYPQAVDCFREETSPLNAEELEAFFGGNALRFLGPDAKTI